MKSIYVTVVAAAGILAVSLLSGTCGNGRQAVRIGSKNFTEQIILGELIAQLIESHTDIPVKRTFNLGGTFVCFKGLSTGKLDCYPEYTGTGLTAILDRPALASGDSVFDIVKKEFEEQWDLIWLRPLAFNNTYTLAMRREQAQQLGVETISDLIDHADDLQPGFDHEFLERPDGYPGLAKKYGFTFEHTPREVDPGLMYKAVAEEEVDVICAFATDGRIRAFDLVRLRDDKNFFPPYHPAPLVRREILSTYPVLESILSRLGGRISDSTMTAMNYAVDEQGIPADSAARRFLLQSGMIPADSGE